MNNKDQLKYSLNKLFIMFKDKPNILIDYFIKYDALKEEFVNKIINSSKLNNTKEEEKPFFKNIEDVKSYYSTPFEENENILENKESEEDILKKQLNTALEEEDYEKAAKIRDYIKKIDNS